MYSRRFEALISTVNVQPDFDFHQPNVLDINAKTVDILRVLHDLYINIMTCQCLTQDFLSGGNCGVVSVRPRANVSDGINIIPLTPVLSGSTKASLTFPSSTFKA